MTAFLNKLFFFLYSKACTFHNNKYYKSTLISDTVSFCPEYPGFVTLINLSNIQIGEKSVLNRFTHINPGTSHVQIGKYCHLGQRLTIYAFNHRYEYADSIPYDALQVEKPVIIRDFVWIGANVTIVPGVIIGEGAVIGAGSVVTKNVPKHAIMGGNPASVLKFRNSEEYYLLKERKAFF